MPSTDLVRYTYTYLFPPDPSSVAFFSSLSGSLPLTRSPSLFFRLSEKCPRMERQLLHSLRIGFLFLFCFSIITTTQHEGASSSRPALFSQIQLNLHVEPKARKAGIRILLCYHMAVNSCAEKLALGSGQRCWTFEVGQFGWAAVKRAVNKPSQNAPYQYIHMVPFICHGTNMFLRNSTRFSRRNDA